MYTSTVTYENKPDTINFGVNTDHLGNVRAVVSGIRQPVDNDGDGETDEYQADVKFYADYYPYGMLQPGRSFNAGDYRFGFQGQEKLDEITGVTGSHLDFGARIYDSRVGKFLSIDPLANENFERSPYHFVSNNPINRIDPDGRDDFELNDKGEIINRTENKEADNVYILDDKGKRVDGQSISFEYGTIGDVKNPTVKVKDKKGNVSEETLTLFEVKGDENATKMFEFLADPANIGVEWTHAKIGTKDSDQNIVGSSHDKSSTPVGHYLRMTKYTLKEVNHNHPSGNYLPSRGDKQGAAKYKVANPNVKLHIYTHPNRYSEYDEKGTLDFSDFEPEIKIIETKKK